MRPQWSILFWFQLKLETKIPTNKGIITSYKGITVFLTVDDHVIGINDGEADYLGPRITGLESAPWIHYGLTKDVSRITLYLNGMKAMEIAEREIVYKTEEFHAKAGDSSHIRMIDQDISDWSDKRESMFKIKQETTGAYRLLSPVEQEDQLRKRVQALEELLQAFRAGKTHFFEDILANLRSLLFYKSKSPNYDPLLLRIAAFKHMSLPVYVIPVDDALTKHITDSEPAIVDLSSVSFEPVIPCVRKVDFQEFLEKPTLLYEGQQISPLAIIEKIATTQSTAHFDQRIPLVIEGLKDTPILFGANLLDHYILTLAELVAKLGHYVLDWVSERSQK